MKRTRLFIRLVFLVLILVIAIIPTVVLASEGENYGYGPNYFYNPFNHGYFWIIVSHVHTDTSPMEICFMAWMDEICGPVANDAHINIPYIHGSANLEDIMKGQLAILVLDKTSTIHTITVIMPQYEDSTHE